MSTPWLSILTITMGDPEGLQRTLLSTERWRAAGVEHVVIDGGGSWTQHSLPPGQTAHAPLLIQRPPAGISDAFNAGLSASHGEWVWFLNGGDRVDDRLEPEFLRALLALNRAEILIGGITYEGSAGPLPHPSPRFRWPPVHSWIPHPSTLVRRRLFQRFGGFDDQYRIVMDYEWWLRVMTKDVEVDVLSVPFSVFALGGVSQDVSAGGRLEQERDRAVGRHQVQLAREWIGAGVRLANATGAAAFRMARRRMTPRSGG